MPRNGEETRASLIRAAEKLFAEKGIEAVSMREINRESGQRNATALQYHFSDRWGLLRAVVAKHSVGVEQRRHELLDKISDAATTPLRELAIALVEPEAEELSDRNGGREYLRIMAQLLNRPVPHFDLEALKDPRGSINRWRELVAPLLPELSVNRLHRRFTAMRIMFVELARRAESPARRDDRLFVSHLVDLIEAILAAPLSSETSELLAQKEKRHR